MKHEGLRMHEKQLLDFLLELPQPLGFGKNLKEKNDCLQTTQQVNLRRQAAKVITKLNLETDIEGYVYFHELMYGLMKRAFAQDVMRVLTLEGFRALNQEEIKAMKIIQSKKNKSICHLKDSQIYQLSGGKKKNLKFLSSKEVANPLHQILFVNMSYKAWANYTKKKMLMKNSAQVEQQQYDTNEIISSNACSLADNDFILSDEDDYQANKKEYYTESEDQYSLAQGNSFEFDNNLLNESSNNDSQEVIMIADARISLQDTGCYENKDYDTANLKLAKKLKNLEQYDVF
eukprot:TRINITY_DN17508_c0_g1_i1.p1 TRINITY_DN17508_c0_g1~~TRINITY_DN17508_c0_g1_i1.p1  ORF type:complete len:289 (+),score=63.18 TRINITY_DN17508_c0_g1_i1:72-938(+)